MIMAYAKLCMYVISVMNRDKRETLQIHTLKRMKHIHVKFNIILTAYVPHINCSLPLLRVVTE